MPNKLFLVVGVSGVTCGGKTTLANKLHEILPKSKLFSQDDYFLDVDDSRHVWIPELNHINFELLTSLDMPKLLLDLKKILQDGEMVTISEFKQNGAINHDKIDVRTQIREKIGNYSNLEIIIVEGFSIFNYKPLLPFFHLKYYLTLSREECFKRRIQRVYDPPDCPGYFEECAWPEHLKQLEEIQNEVENVKYFNEHSREILNEILLDILKYL